MSERPMFNDSISNNIEILKMLLEDVAPSNRQRAKGAATAIERTFLQLKRDYPKDPYVALGAAFALFKLAEGLVQQGQDAAETGGLIQLLS